MEITAEPVREKTNPNFEEQFANHLTLRNGSAVIKFVDLEPEEHGNGIPIMLAAGWSETISYYKRALQVIFDENFRTIALDYPRKGEQNRIESEFPKAQLRKAQAILAVIEGRNIDKVDVIAHSEGAVSICIAASLKPERFRNIVLVSPGGLIGKDNLASLAIRFALTSLKEALEFRKLSPNFEKSNDFGILKFFLENPKRALDETRGLSQFDISNLLKKLGDLGICISIIHGVDDSLFQTQKIIETAKQNPPLDVKGFYSVKGGHTKLARDPAYVRAALDALTSLEYQRSQRENRSQP